MIVVAYGIGARIAKGAIKRLRQENLKVGMIRPITLWPFPSKALQEMAKTVSDFFVFEMSAGQMVEDVRLALGGKRTRSLLREAGRRHPDACRALQDHLAPLHPGTVRRQEEETMKTVYSATQAAERSALPLLSRVRPRHHQPPAHGSDRGDGPPGRGHLRGSGRVRHAPLQLLRDRRDRVGPRARGRGGHRHQAGAAARTWSSPTRATATSPPSAPPKASTPPTGARTSP